MTEILRLEIRPCRFRRFLHNVASSLCFSEGLSAVAFSLNLSLPCGLSVVAFSLNFSIYVVGSPFRSPLRSVGTPSPLPRGSCFFQPGNNFEPCTDFLALCRRALHLRKSEQRKFGYQMLSANSTKRNPCSVFVFHLYSQACYTAFI